MAVSLDQYRAAIGLFNNCHKTKLSSDLFFWNFIFPNFIFAHLVLPNIILQCGDIELNPGPVQNKSVNNIHIGHSNVRSLTAPVKDPLSPNRFISKFELVKKHVQHYEYDFFGLSETWLDKSIDDDKLMIPGYQKPIRRDISRHERGTLVYLSKSFPAERKDELEPIDSEIICIEVRMKQKKVLICNCYRSPSSDIIDFCADVDSLIDKARDTYDDIIFIGDMNGRNSLFWCDDITNTDGRILNCTYETHNYEQMIHEPTRVVENTKSCIDLIFTRNPHIFSEVGTRDKIAPICDHHPIYGILKSTLKKPKCFKRWVWDFKRADFEQMRFAMLNAPWQNCFVNKNVNVTVSNWMELFINIAESYIPHYEATIRPGDKEFMNSNIRTLMRKRDRLWKQHKNDEENTYIAEQYRQARNLVVAETRKSKEELENKKENEISEVNVSSKQWWSSCKTAIGKNNRSDIGPILDTETNVLITDDTDKANLFNKFFVSQSDLDESSANLPCEPPSPDCVINQLVLQPENVYKILSCLDPAKATGPDGIGNLILKEAAVAIAQPLSHLFNFCVSMGYFPDCWKLAYVTPLFKKNNETLCTNYRPISLLPCISKVFEKLLFDHIFHFLRSHNLLNKHQSGFIPGDSTINQLIKICNNLYQCMEDGDEMIGIFLDLTKAFDKVWHKGLLYKLKKIGVCGKLYDLMVSYLTERKQQVVLNGCKSEPQLLHAGVPQGSVLGPLLFLIYINDISDNVQCDSFLFADDTSIFKNVTNLDINSAANAINNDLNEIHKWSKQWLVSVNASKTIVMLFSKKKTPSILPNINLGDNALQQVTSHKHLGMTFTNNLSWTEHIENTVSKCNRIIGMFKPFKYKWPRSALEICYKSFIRSILEYGDIIYDNCNQSDKDNLESVQLEAARLVTGAKRCTSHANLYRELGWQTLHQRRHCKKLTKMYDIVHGNAPHYLCSIINNYISPNTRNTRAVAHKNFTIPKCKSKMYEHSFVISALSIWNKIEPSKRNLPSRFAFRSFAKRLFHQEPLLFNHDVGRAQQVHFSQIRMGFSSLNHDLYMKGCVTVGTCACGDSREDQRHFLLKCKKYTKERCEMFTNIKNVSSKVNITLNLLLFGNKQLSVKENLIVLKHVCNYIKQTKRFESNTAS